MKRYIKYFLQIIVFLTLWSCTSDVDFDQAKNIEFNQNFSSAFVYLNLDQNNFLNEDASTEISSLTDFSIIDIFDSAYFQDNLIKANFSFQIENTFDRNFIIILSFLNTNDAITKNFSINVSNNVSFTHLEIFESLDVLSLKLAEKLRITVEIQPSLDASVLAANAEMNLEIKSSTNFIFKVN